MPNSILASLLLLFILLCNSSSHENHSHHVNSLINSGAINFSDFHSQAIISSTSTSSENTLPASYRVDTITGGNDYTLYFREATFSKRVPNHMYFLTSYLLCRLDVLSGEIETIGGCDRNRQDCLSIEQMDATGVDARKVIMNNPSSLMVHFDFNIGREIIYVSLYSRVIRFDLNDGKAFHFAGSQQNYGFNGDSPMNATSAMFALINSMASDSKGNIYICDAGNNRIRKVDLNGIITTISGGDGVNNKQDGPARNITFVGLKNLLSGRNDTLFVSDLFGLVKISTSDGMAKLLSSQSLLSEDINLGPSVNSQFEPVSLVEKSDGSLVVFSRKTIFTINTENYITQIYPQVNQFIDYVAFVSNDDTLYMSLIDSIVKVTLTDNNRTMISKLVDSKLGPQFEGIKPSEKRYGFISALGFNETSGEIIYADSSSGFLYAISSDLSKTISIPIENTKSKRCSDKNIETNTFPMVNPTSIVVKEDKMFLVNTGIPSSIHMFNREQSESCFIAGSLTPDRLLMNSTGLSTLLNRPMSLCCSNGCIELIVADTEHNRIIRYNVNKDYAIVVAGNGFAGFSGDGGLAINAQLNRPHGVYYDTANDEIYVADTNNHRIRKIYSNGTIITVAGTGIAGFNGHLVHPLLAQLNSPKFITNSTLGLLISDTNNNIVRLLLNNYPVLTTLIGTGVAGMKEGTAKTCQLNSPVGLSFFKFSENTYDIYVADTNNHRIIRASFKFIEIDNNGIILTDGQVYNAAGTGFSGYNGDGMLATNARLFFPTHVIAITHESIIFSDTFNNRVRKVTNGIISTIVGTGQSGYNEERVSTLLNFPTGIAGSSGKIYFADSGNNIIRMYNDLYVYKIVGGNGDSSPVVYANVNPTKIAISNKNEIYVSEGSTNMIRIIDQKGYIYTTIGTGQFGFKGEHTKAISAMLATPSALAISPITNQLFFCDSGNNRIRMVDSLLGDISTVAGTGDIGYDENDTKAILSKFNNPGFLSFMSNGDIVVGDTLNNCIRIISMSDGSIRTILGSQYSNIFEGNGIDSKLATTSGITDLYITKDNTIYFSEQKRIRKLTPYCSDGYILDGNKTHCIPVCYGFAQNETSSCNGNGLCALPNVCRCNNFFKGMRCEIPTCFGIGANESTSCSSPLKGSCISPNKCLCNDGFYGDQCEISICFSKLVGESCGGSKRGFCNNKDNCTCTENYTGRECQLFSCFGLSETNPKVCNGHGDCIEGGTCQCNVGYSGLSCENATQRNAIIGVSVVVILIILIIITISSIAIVVLFKKNRKQNKILKSDISLDERLLLDDYIGSIDSSKSTYSINSSSEEFIIPLDKIGMEKPICRLGEGGMGSVFQTKWNGMVVAVKVFDLNNINISEEDFKIEAILLSKLRHPNIINFYGISSSPTKRYIVMECLEQSLEKLISKLQFEQLNYSLMQKLALICNISNGIEYLHTLKPRMIIHRDLKPQNILMDKNGNAKLCDFGLSKTISQGTISTVTNQIGTCYYMSPEMISSDSLSLNPKHATAIDIYSFSIIIWQVLFEISDPYMSNVPKVLKKLGQKEKSTFQNSYQLSRMICEENLRPIIPFSSLESCQEWCSQFMPMEVKNYGIIFELANIIRNCWDKAPSKRPDIKQLTEELESLTKQL